jgi:hypothetical protein
VYFVRVLQEPHVSALALEAGSKIS